MTTWNCGLAAGEKLGTRVGDPLAGMRVTADKAESRDAFLTRSERLSSPACGRATASSKEDEGCLENATPGLGRKVTSPFSLFSGFNHMPCPFYTPTPKYLTRSVLILLRHVF